MFGGWTSRTERLWRFVRCTAWFFWPPWRAGPRPRTSVGAVAVGVATEAAVPAAAITVVTAAMAARATATSGATATVVTAASAASRAVTRPATAGTPAPAGRA